MNLKKLNLTLAFLGLLLLVPTLEIAFGQSGTQPYFMAGVQQPYSYVIYKEGSIHYAKNSYGLVVYSGDNASYVIQNAINDLGIEGGTIYIKKGTYSLSTTITLLSYQTIIGESRHETILKLANGVNKDVIDTAFEGYYVDTAVEIRDLTIDGNRDNNAQGHCILFRVWRGRIDNCDICYGSEDAIHIYGINNTAIENIIENCIIRDCDHNGVTFKEKATDSFVSRCIIKNMGNNGIYLLNGTANGNSIHDNHFYTCSNYSIFAGGSHLSIKGNYFEPSKFSHTILLARGFIRDRLIIGNIFHTAHGVDNTYDDIYLDGVSTNWCYYVSIIGNRFIDLGGNTSRYNINLHYPQKCIIQSNSLYGYGTKALNLVKHANNIFDISNNLGYVTENSGTETSVGDNEWIAHGLSETPTVVIITPHTSDDVACMDRNATHFQVDNDATSFDLDWYAKYEP